MKNYIYAIYDTVTDDCIAIYKANNDKDCIRQLVFCKFFNYNRLEDTEIYNTGLYMIDKGGIVNDTDMTNPTKLDIKKILKDLSINVENESERIEGSVDEVKDKIMAKAGKNNE